MSTLKQKYGVLLYGRHYADNHIIIRMLLTFRNCNYIKTIYNQRKNILNSRLRYKAWGRP